MLASRTRRIDVAIGLLALLALVALGCGDSTGAADRYTVAANRLCGAAEARIARASRQHRDAFHDGDPSPLARSMFNAVGTLQSRLKTLEAPQDKLVGTLELSDTVFEAERPILELIGVPSEKRIRVDVQKLESVASRARNLASDLDLSTCARLRLGVDSAS